MGLETVIVIGCKICPLYQYELNEEFAGRSRCKHPISPIENITRIFEKGEGVVPETPNNCPIKNNSLTLTR